MQTSDGLLSFFPHFCIQETAWTIIQHNGSDVTRVRNTNPENPYTGFFEYVASMEQLQATINRAEHCEQELTYYCKKSRLVSKEGKWTGASIPLPMGCLTASAPAEFNCAKVLAKSYPGRVLPKCLASLSQSGSHGDAVAWRKEQGQLTLSFVQSLDCLWRLSLASVGGLHRKGFLLTLGECSVSVPCKGQLTHSVCFYHGKELIKIWLRFLKVTLPCDSFTDCWQVTLWV